MAGGTEREIAIILDRAEAEAWLAAGHAADRCLCFAPDAGLILRRAGRDVVELEDVVPAFTHARNTVRAERILSAARGRLRASDLDRHEAEALRIFLFYVLCPLLLVERALKAFPGAAFAVPAGGAVRRCATVASALETLGDELHPPVARFTAREYSPAHGRVAVALNRLVAPLYRSSVTVCHLDLANPVPRRVSGLIAAERPDVLVLHCHPPGRKMSESLRLSAKSVLNVLVPGRRSRGVRVFRPSTIPMPAPVDPGALPVLWPDDPVLDRLLRRAAARELPKIRREVDAGKALAGRLRPDLVILDNLVFPATIAAAAGMARAGARVLLVNHGSHTRPGDRLSALAQRLWAEQGRVNDPIVTDLIAKNPATARLAEEIDRNRPQILPFQAFRRFARAEGADDIFRIVLAGNYMDARDHVPWQTETSGEFYRGIIEFAEAVARTPGAELLIKLKTHKHGLPVDALAALVAEPRFGGRVRVDTSSSVGALFERMDLMVSNTSSTVEEALTCRVPVFLNTWRRRYFHVPARLVPPTPSDRAAVYGTRSADAIGPMLSAIMAAHRTLLTDEEVRGLIWLEADMVGPAELTRRLIGAAGSSSCPVPRRSREHRPGRRPSEPKLTEHPHA